MKSRKDKILPAGNDGEKRGQLKIRESSNAKGARKKKRVQTEKARREGKKKTISFRNPSGAAGVAFTTTVGAKGKLTKKRMKEKKLFGGGQAQKIKKPWPGGLGPRGE